MEISNLVHISVDDVIDTFYWIEKYKPKSIFEQPLFFKIKKWHEQYDLIFDLYMFESKGDFDIKMVPVRYWREIAKNCEWIKLAWHRRTAGILVDSENEELLSIERFYKFLIMNCGHNILSDTVRLHRWIASKKIMDSLKSHGINKFLTSDSDEISYDLTTEEMNCIKENYRYEKENIIYKKTVLRLDYFIDGLDISSSVKNIKNVYNITKDNVEVFFHEKYFDKMQNIIQKLLSELEK